MQANQVKSPNYIVQVKSQRALKSPNREWWLSSDSNHESLESLWLGTNSASHPRQIPLPVCVLCVLTKKTNCLLIEFDTHCLQLLPVNDVITKLCSSGSSSSIALNLNSCRETLTFSLRVSSYETVSLWLILWWVFASCYSVGVTWLDKPITPKFCPTLKLASPGQNKLSSVSNLTDSSSMLSCQVNQGEL